MTTYISKKGPNKVQVLSDDHKAFFLHSIRIVLVLMAIWSNLKSLLASVSVNCSMVIKTELKKLGNERTRRKSPITSIFSVQFTCGDAALASKFSYVISCSVWSPDK